MVQHHFNRTLFIPKSKVSIDAPSFHVEIQIQLKQILSEAFITVRGGTRPLTKSWYGRYGTGDETTHRWKVFVLFVFIFCFVFNTSLQISKLFLLRNIANVIQCISSRKSSLHRHHNSDKKCPNHHPAHPQPWLSHPLPQNKQSWRAKEVISPNFAPILSFVRSSWALARIFCNFWPKITSPSRE